jgi:hypothetical protein
MAEEKKTAKASGDNEATLADGDVGGAGEVAEKLQAEQEQGYRGVAVDPTPNEAYSVKGVTSGMPTPETDDDARAEADKALRR